MSKVVAANLVTKMSVESAQFQKEMVKAQKLNHKYKKAANDANGASKKLSAGFKKAANSAAIFSGPLGGVSGRLSSVSSGLGAVGVAGLATGAIITGLTIITAKSLAVFNEYEKGIFKTESLLKATGFAAGLTGDHIENLSRKVALNTLASVEGVRSAAQILLTFKSIQGKTFDKTIALSQDLAEVMGTDIKQAALQLGKALEDPATGLTALKRSGVSFTDAEKDMIRAMQEAGKSAEAQSMILVKLEQQLGGTGTAAAKGMAGSIDTLAQSWDEFLNVFAKKTGAAQAYSDFIDRMGRGMRVATALMDDSGFAQKSAAIIDNRNQLLDDLQTYYKRYKNIRGRDWTPSDANDMQTGKNIARIRTELAQSLTDLAALRTEYVAKEKKARLAGEAAAAKQEAQRQAANLTKKQALGSKTLAVMSKQFADEQELINQKWQQQEEKITKMVLSEVDIKRAGFATIEKLKAFYRDANDAQFNEAFAKIQERNQMEIDAALSKEQQIQAAKEQTAQFEANKAKWKAEQEKREQINTGNNFVKNLQMAGTQNKKMAGLAKTAAIAQATISTYSSAVKAYDSLAMIPYVGPALGAAAAAAAIAAGMVNVSAIKNQPIAGFEGGGYIPDAPRIGGVDGRGGKYAVLHPDESIYDHKKGQGNASSSFSINYSPVINTIDSNGVAELLAEQQETIYNLIANAKADRGEDF